MFGIRYLKAPPTTFVRWYSRGTLRREGPGLSFFYFEPTSTLAAVPLASTDVPFAFAEMTADFQEVQVQGRVSYRVEDPRLVSEVFDMTVDADLRYRSDDHEKLAERLVHEAQVLTRARLGSLVLGAAIADSDTLSGLLRDGLRGSEVVTSMGVAIVSVAVLAIRPNPETARALEAGAREALLQAADQALYLRRNAAVDAERRIRENELKTEIAVEEQRRVIRETQMNAEIAVEEARAKLIDARVENDRKDADARAYSLRASLEPLEAADWRKLMVLGASGDRSSGSMIALAFQQMAENAQKIGTLNVSPELLQSLIAPRGE